jgi:6-phosphofructokinase 1
MNEIEMHLEIQRLGECHVQSPVSGLEFVANERRVLFHSDPKEVEKTIENGQAPLSFEIAGPREKIYFDPSKLKCGIVTCGGLCPGVNDVIRAIVLSLFYHYGVPTVFGFRYGFEGLSYKYGHVPMELNPEVVKGIHQQGGTILGSSRGPQEVTEMVDTLERMNIGLFFAIGGDGTLRGARAIAEEIGRRRLKIGVIGIPKTIDNDISCVQQSFGFETAVTESRTAIYSANMEAMGARNGMGLVKLMGRESGFIAAYATLATSDVNYCLIPEVPFKLEVFLKHLKERLDVKRHAVIVVAEGAGQGLMSKSNDKDPSGNVRLNDIGYFLKEKIENYFRGINMTFSLKYIDPSYTIRSMPANPHDSVFCLLLGHNAVHAGMAGRTNMLVSSWKDQFTHVPISAAVAKRKQVDPKGRLWNSVLASTGQPANMFSD